MLDEQWWTAGKRPADGGRAGPPSTPSTPGTEGWSQARSYSATAYEADRRPNPAAILVNRPTRYQARMQVVTDTGVAMLMRFGAAGWQLEGVYD